MTRAGHRWPLEDIASGITPLTTNFLEVLMSIALAARSFVTAVYLVALGLHGRSQPLAWLIAAAVIAVWAVALTRDRRSAA